jgi:ribosomal protein L21E
MSNNRTDYSVGDRVRVDLPDETDPDHDRYHGEHGRIVDVFEDDASTLTGDDRDSIIYRVQFSNGEELDLRYQAIRPPITRFD